VWKTGDHFNMVGALSVEDAVVRVAADRNSPDILADGAVHLG
jgi:hypothetical protein